VQPHSKVDQAPILVIWRALTGCLRWDYTCTSLTFTDCCLRWSYTCTSPTNYFLTCTYWHTLTIASGVHTRVLHWQTISSGGLTRALTDIQWLLPQVVIHVYFTDKLFSQVGLHMYLTDIYWLLPQVFIHVYFTDKLFLQVGLHVHLLTYSDYCLRWSYTCTSLTNYFLRWAYTYTWLTYTDYSLRWSYTCTSPTNCFLRWDYTCTWLTSDILWLLPRVGIHVYLTDNLFPSGGTLTLRSKNIISPLRHLLEPYGFQGQLCGSRSITLFKVNHGIKFKETHTLPSFL
jgi:hypothetical protein